MALEGCGGGAKAGGSSGYRFQDGCGSMFTASCGASCRMDEKEDTADGISSRTLRVGGATASAAGLPAKRLGRGMFRCSGRMMSFASPVEALPLQLGLLPIVPSAEESVMGKLSGQQLGELCTGYVGVTREERLLAGVGTAAFLLCCT